MQVLSSTNSAKVRISLRSAKAKSWSLLWPGVRTCNHYRPLKRPNGTHTSHSTVRPRAKQALDRRRQVCGCRMMAFVKNSVRRHEPLQ